MFLKSYTRGQTKQQATQAELHFLLGECELVNFAILANTAADAIIGM